METRNKPNRKVVAGGFAGAVTVVMVWATHTFTAITVPAEVAAATTTIITAVVSYFVPNR